MLSFQLGLICCCIRDRLDWGRFQVLYRLRLWHWHLICIQIHRFRRRLLYLMKNRCCCRLRRLLRGRIAFFFLESLDLSPNVSIPLFFISNFFRDQLLVLRVEMRH